MKSVTHDLIPLSHKELNGNIFFPSLAPCLLNLCKIKLYFTLKSKKKLPSQKYPRNKNYSFQHTLQLIYMVQRNLQVLKKDSER